MLPQLTGKFHDHRGFTLIELLIVVAIIGILAAIAIPNFLQAQTRAKIARGMAEEKSMALALETYYVDNNGYLSRPPFGEATTCGLDGGWLWHLTSPVEYMTSLPERAPFAPWRSQGLDPNANYWGYLYWGGYWWEQMLHGSWAGAYHPSWQKAKYVILTVGPTREYSLFHSLNWVFPYDPTNGTMSYGDIIYVGGPTGDAGWNSFSH